LQEIPEHLFRRTQDRQNVLDSRQFLNFNAGQQGQGPRRSRNYSGKTYDSVESARTFLNQLNQRTTKPGFVKGAEVTHAKFGSGRILQVQETGDDLKITVRFMSAGIKKLLQSYAKLKLV
tara:strand:+ start:87 stop:446 length:360 start_codon:yes stop_codon:yes gene_type:complete